MKFRVLYQQTGNNAGSPIRIVEQTTGREVGWINRYLDREYVRRLANTTLRSYAHSLLHFVRWWESVHHTGDIAEGDLTESTLLDYVRFQSSQQPRPSPFTINHPVPTPHRPIPTPAPPRRSRPPQRVPRCSLPNCPRLSSTILATKADGPWPAASGDESVARQGAQTQHRAALGG